MKTEANSSENLGQGLLERLLCNNERPVCSEVAMGDSSSSNLELTTASSVQHIHRWLVPFNSNGCKFCEDKFSYQDSSSISQKWVYLKNIRVKTRNQIATTASIHFTVWPLVAIFMVLESPETPQRAELQISKEKKSFPEILLTPGGDCMVVRQVADSSFIVSSRCTHGLPHVLLHFIKTWRGRCRAQGTRNCWGSHQRLYLKTGVVLHTWLYM